MTTTKKARTDVAAARLAGVSDAILKPFTPSGLREKIAELSRMREAS
jgi:DNA-binding response OmpR family regulator